MSLHSALYFVEILWWESAQQDRTKFFMRSFLLIFTLLPLVLFSQTQEEVEVKTILVWVKADQDGKAVPGLTANDFEVEEDGKKVTSTCFEEFVVSTESAVNATTTQQQLADQPEFTGKRIAIFLDQINTSEVEFQYMQSRLAEFFEQIDGKKMQAMLSVFPPYERVVPFTEDITEVQTKLDSLSGNLHRDQEMMFRRKQIINFLEKKPFNSALLATAVDQAMQYQSEEIQMARMTLKALEDFGSYLSELQQSEHTIVLFISGGLNIEPGRQYFDIIRARTGEEEGLPLGGVRGVSWDLRKEVRETIAKMNFNNLTVYTINTRGPISVVNEATEFQKKYLPKDNEYLRDHQEMMDIIADDTGGISFRNSLNFKFGFNQVMNDLNHQYLICYKAPQHNAAGEFHKIKVKTKVKDVKLRFRTGYID
jgi:VWFA-related protein